eukprot:39937-Eustigmatos_ZCMA.PRE.1
MSTPPHLLSQSPAHSLCAGRHGSIERQMLLPPPSPPSDCGDVNCSPDRRIESVHDRLLTRHLLATPPEQHVWTAEKMGVTFSTRGD